MYSFSARVTHASVLTVDDLVCHDNLNVELRAHAQVHKIALLLREVLQRLLRFAHEVSDQRRVLHSIKFVLWERAHWNA